MTFPVTAGLILMGLALIGLGLYFHSWLAPWRALLRAAATSGPMRYQGQRYGSRWLLVVEYPDRVEDASVAEGDLGTFLLQQALASLPDPKALRLQAAIGPDLGLNLTQPWEFVRARSLEMRRAPAKSFSIDRHELLRMAVSMLPFDLALEDRSATH